MGACPFWKNFRSGTVGLRCVASRPVRVSRYSRVHIVIAIGIINNCPSALRKFLAVGIAGKILGLPITASRRYESFFQFVSHLLFFQFVSNLLWQPILGSSTTAIWDLQQLPGGPVEVSDAKVMVSQIFRVHRTSLRV